MNCSFPLLASVVTSETCSIFNVDVEHNLVGANKARPPRLPPKRFACQSLSGLFVIQQQYLSGCQAEMESDSHRECFNVGPQAMRPVLLGLHGWWQGAPSISETKATFQASCWGHRGKPLMITALIHHKGLFNCCSAASFISSWRLNNAMKTVCLCLAHLTA